jgi:hypothetical protein
MTNYKTTATIDIYVKQPTLMGLEPLLQQGFFVESRVGITIHDFLEKQMGLPPEYISQRITTIFLDSKPVDDIKTATPRNGSTLALSGAMPGLVGALLRQNSILASFRSTITYRESGGDLQRNMGRFKIKLFNLLLNELGPRFLEAGIILDTTGIPAHLENLITQHRDNISRIRFNGESVQSLDSLIKELRGFTSTSPEQAASKENEGVLFSIIPAQTD